MELGDFLNEYAANLEVFLPLVVIAALGLPVFAYFFNDFIDKLDDGEHTSVYVAFGVGITIVVAALFSWKGALLHLILFTLDGLPMIVGDYRRARKQKLEKTIRVKRLPYKANAFIDDIEMAAKESRRMLNSAFKTKDDMERAIKLATISNELNIISEKIYELKSIQRGEG